MSITQGAASGLETLQQSHIFALKQIGENLAAQTRRLEGLTDKMDDVRERLVRVEAQEAGKLVEGVRADFKAALGRIDQLEAERDKVAGIAALGAWLAKSAPWLAGGIAAFMAGIGIKAMGR